MRRKHNPWVALVALLLLVTLLVTVCTGCGVKLAETEEPDRFTFEESSRQLGLYAYIITDTETGAQYLLVDTAYGTGLTVLQSAPDEEDDAHG